ncbi:MAG: hypothetical protein F6K47_20510 [Symploca sp. SIO2E6]|nr:hypothetical protein [Symploca sp. SIO2E6]
MIARTKDKQQRTNNERQTTKDKQQTTNDKRQTTNNKQQTTLLQILAVTAFLSLGFLLKGNMGNVNEVYALPLARQYADPTWVPGDWYYNEPAGYRLLFVALFGHLAVAWGFLATSIIGRLIYYTLISSGLVLLARKLGISLAPLLVGIGLFLYVNHYQGMAAQEWLVGGVEAKSFAYGFFLLAIRLMLGGSYRLMALMLGLAASFHVLVGGWAFLAVVGWLLWRRKQDFADISYLGSVLLIYLVASGFAIWPVVQQLFTRIPSDYIDPSYLFVFVRAPHHLNPLSWDSDWWLLPLAYLLVLAISWFLFQRQQQSEQSSPQHIARKSLAEFTLITLVPFVLGLAITPLDTQGQLLQYFFFRLGDIMLPLNSCLLLVCALEQTFIGSKQRLFSLFCILLLSIAVSILSFNFYHSLLAVTQFPGKEQGVEPEWQDMCTWIKTNTPHNTLVISPPVEFVNFTWLTERPTIVKFRLLPSVSASLIEWIERLNDLSGDLNPWPSEDSKEDNRGEIRHALTTGYYSLQTPQVESLMLKYHANYFVTRSEHQLELPIAYQNSLFVFYHKRG